MIPTRYDRFRRAAGPAGHGEGWLRRLAGYCARHKSLCLVTFGASLVAILVMTAIPLILRDIIDRVAGSRAQPIWPGAALLMGAALVGFGSMYLRRYHSGRLSLEVQHDLRIELFESLTRLDGARQDQLHTGQIVSRSIADLNLAQNLLATLPVMLANTLLFVLSIVVMFVLAPLLALISLAVGPALLALSIASRRRLFAAEWDAQQKAGEVAGVVEGAIAGVRVVKGFGQENQEIDRLEGTSRLLYGARVRAVLLMARYSPALGTIPVLSQVGVLALGGWMAIEGQITLGVFLAFASYLAQMIIPVLALASLITTGQEARASVIRVFEVIDSRPVLTERPGALVLPAGPKDIELDHVHFGYLPSQPVLHGLSLRVEPGQTLAVVGTSGSGKSTISLLLPRFYDVCSGVIRVGGHDVREVTLDSLRASIGQVPEESFLFADTVRNNISYGRPDATGEQIVAASRAAGAEDFILDLPHGYDTVIGERGLSLSGGQRQRLALARALITDPGVLILDDATSAVDARTEAQIHASLRQAMAGRTTLLIAHRRSTLELADQIALLDSGRLVDQGTHEELTRRCPMYRLLLADPGDDAAGSQPAAARRARPGPGGITASLWPASSGSQAAGAAHAAPGTGWLAGVPAPPRLLARVAALPTADHRPDVDLSLARAPDPRFTLRRLLRPFAIALAIGLVLDGLDVAAGAAMPLLVRGGVDHGIEQRLLSSGARFHAIAAVSLIGLALVLAGWAVTWAQLIVVGRNGERLLYTLRVKLFSHLQRLGLDYYERERSGKIMTRMTTDIDSLSAFLQTGLITMISSVLSLASVMVALLVINLRLGLTLLTVIPPLVAASLVFRAKSSRAYRAARDRASAVNADLQENVGGLRVTQAFRREQLNRERFAELSSAYRASRLRALHYLALYFPFVQALSTAAGALVLFVAGREVRSGALTAGGLIAYLLYIDLLFWPIQQLSQVFDGYQQAAVGLGRIQELLRTPTATPASARPVVPGPLHGRIELCDVHFSYPGQPREALAGVTLSVAAGETVALVGSTGAGKSTLVKLVARFYDVRSGAVLVDGTDVRAYDLPAYRRRLGVVPQEAYLFPGTVRDAIAYGRPEASDGEVEAAAREVGAIEIISGLPGGFRHEVTERGRNLSAGQRQLVALARAYLVDPAILLLDEATAALDPAAEEAVTQAADRLARRRTTLVVAHRLTTAARADRIIVLDAGRVAETGTHAGLLAASGLYAAMWAAFSGPPAPLAGTVSSTPA